MALSKLVLYLQTISGYCSPGRMLRHVLDLSGQGRLIFSFELVTRKTASRMENIPTYSARTKRSLRKMAPRMTATMGLMYA